MILGRGTEWPYPKIEKKIQTLTTPYTPIQRVRQEQTMSKYLSGNYVKQLLMNKHLLHHDWSDKQKNCQSLQVHKRNKFQWKFTIQNGGNQSRKDTVIVSSPKP